MPRAQLSEVLAAIRPRIRPGEHNPLPRKPPKPSGLESCARLGGLLTSAVLESLDQSLPVDRFHRIDTIGISDNKGKISSRRFFGWGTHPEVIRPVDRHHPRNLLECDARRRDLVVREASGSLAVGIADWIRL